jgi:hypothetical protein
MMRSPLSLPAQLSESLSEQPYLPAHNGVDDPGNFSLLDVGLVED